MSEVADQARELLHAVTAGPWEASADSGDTITVAAANDLIVEYDVYGCTEDERNQLYRNACFIAEARSLIPELIAENTALHAQLSKPAPPPGTPF